MKAIKVASAIATRIPPPSTQSPITHDRIAAIIRIRITGSLNLRRY